MAHLEQGSQDWPQWGEGRRQTAVVRARNSGQLCDLPACLDTAAYNGYFPQGRVVKEIAVLGLRGAAWTQGIVTLFQLIWQDCYNYLQDWENHSNGASNISVGT